MPRLISRHTVALVTFSIGLILTSIFKTPTTPILKQPARHVDEVLVEKQPLELLPPKPSNPDIKIYRYSDLSVVVAMSEPNPKPPSLSRAYIELVKHGPTVIDLDLGQSIDDQELTLNFRDNDEYRVFERYRTSMSVSAEGPHLDLVNWRHFDSPWTQLKSVGHKRFRTLATEQMDDSKFPSTTNEEMVKEVRRLVGTDWPEIVELVKDCHSPKSGACFVSISSIYLRIQKRLGARWTDVGVVEFRLPMGC